MAIYHLHARVISQFEDRSSEAASAHRSAGRITDGRTGRIYNFGRKNGVIYTAIWAPVRAPA
jgi:hypothetical protein